MEATTLVWQITWTKSFPTLLASLLFVPSSSSSCLSDNDDNNDDEYNDDDEMMIVCLQKLALNVIWSNQYYENHNSCLSNKYKLRSNFMTNNTTRQQSSMSTLCNDDNCDNIHFIKNHETSVSSKVLSHDDTSRIQTSRRNHDNHGHSVIERNEMKSLSSPFPWMNSLGYGEMSEDAILIVIHYLVHRKKLLPTNPYVVDLGSGDGKVLLTCAIAMELSYALGIEIIPELHMAAISNEEHYQRYSYLIPEKQTHFEWSCSNFTVTSNYMKWIHKADLVFVHATVFEADLMKQLNMICQLCRKNTYFCLVSKKLEPCNIFETIIEISLPMSWGRGNVFIQKKI